MQHNTLNPICLSFYGCGIFMNMLILCSFVLLIEFIGFNSTKPEFCWRSLFGGLLWSNRGFTVTALWNLVVGFVVWVFLVLSSVSKLTTLVVLSGCIDSSLMVKEFIGFNSTKAEFCWKSSFGGLLWSNRGFTVTALWNLVVGFVVWVFLVLSSISKLTTLVVLSGCIGSPMLHIHWTGQFKTHRENCKLFRKHLNGGSHCFNKTAFKEKPRESKKYEIEEYYGFLTGLT